jgi:hypothetical protein
LQLKDKWRNLAIINLSKQFCHIIIRPVHNLQCLKGNVLFELKAIRNEKTPLLTRQLRF